MIVFVLNAYALNPQLNVLLNVSSSIVGLDLHLINAKSECVGDYSRTSMRRPDRAFGPYIDSLRHFVAPVSFKHGPNELSF